MFVLDLVLRRPTTFVSKLTRPLKKFLLRRPEHFIHYFRDLEGYVNFFGIGPSRSSYVPFKSGILGRYPFTPRPDGDYVLCFGWSERDYDSFVNAMTALPYPGAIPQPNFTQLKQNGSRFTVPLANLPKNIHVLENDGSISRAVEIISNARVVALPIKAQRISSSGISTYLMAMVLGKCVIITEGPGVSDVLTNEALFVPAANTSALGSAIRRVWEDSTFRERIAAAGRRYAESCGTTEDLYQRVLDVIAAKRSEFPRLRFNDKRGEIHNDDYSP